MLGRSAFKPVRLDRCGHGWRRDWPAPCPGCTRQTLASEIGEYWHGGAPGRLEGELLVPRKFTGAPGLASYLPTSAVKVSRDDRVYVGTTPDVARLFAALYYDRASREIGGTIYRVRPVLALEVDPGAKEDGVSYQVTAALVVQVCETLARREALAISRKALGREAMRGRAKRWAR